MEGIQSPPPESFKNRLDKCCYCHIVALALDTESPSSLWGCCLFSVVLKKFAQILPACAEPRPQDLLELLFLLETP